jgi:hypothetical protein
MISLRFFNFRSRGLCAATDTIEHMVRWIMHQNTAKIATTVRVFLKRKVVKADKTDRAAVRKADEKLAIFKATVVSDFDAALGKGKGEAWWASHVQPVADTLRAELVCQTSL